VDPERSAPRSRASLFGVPFEIIGEVVFLIERWHLKEEYKSE
jgi:hypothetical protein